MSAMASEVSDTNQKGIKRYINSDGGLGEVVVNDAWSVQEKLRQCRDKERSLSVDLQLVSKSLQLEKEHSNKYQTSLHGCEVARQLSNDIRSSCQKKNERCERRLEELESNSTTIQGHFKSQIADLESQIVNLTTKHTEYITTLNKSQVEKASAITAQRDDLRTRLENEKNQTESLKKKYSMCVDGIDAETNRRLTKEINTLTALNDDLSTQLAAQGKEAESCRDNYDKGHARELTQLGPLVKLGGGGFLLGAVGIGGFVWKRMSNNLKQEKKERAKLSN